MCEQKVGDYCYNEKTDELGEGSFGRVFLAHHFQQKDSKAAIKKINLLKSTVKTTSKEVLSREIDILKAVSSDSHPNLVSLLFHSRDVTTIYLVMEFCNGGDFRGYLEDKKLLKESVIQQFFRQIGAGMKVLHDRQILHRDLKPENILLSFEGTGYPAPEHITLKIADFGLGRFLPPDGKADTFCGTLIYMAPEIRDRKLYDKKVDMWSIGAMIYECLVTIAVLMKDPKFPNITKIELPANTSTEVEQLLGKLLSQKPEDRCDINQLLSDVFFVKQFLQVHVRNNNSSTTITVSAESSVDALIQEVHKRLAPSTDVSSILLYSRSGLPLDNRSGSSLRQLGITSGSTLELCYRLPGG